MTTAKARIEQELQKLVGLPFWDSGSAGLQWFIFGEEQEITDPLGRKRITGEFSLHLQCAWNVTCYKEPGLVITSADHFRLPRDDNFDCLKDEKFARFFSYFADKQLIVQHVRVTPNGGFRLSMAHACQLSVFVNPSSEHEHWRLFRPGSEEHFVVGGEDDFRSEE